jgi:hypothetical protein
MKSLNRQLHKIRDIINHTNKDNIKQLIKEKEEIEQLLEDIYEFNYYEG